MRVEVQIGDKDRIGSEGGYLVVAVWVVAVHPWLGEGRDYDSTPDSCSTRDSCSAVRTSGTAPTGPDRLTEDDEVNCW